MNTAQLSSDGAADIARRMEAVPPLPAHRRWATIIGLGCFLDGFTTLSVAAALTVLVSSLHFDFNRVGLLISASFLGMLIGAVVFGAISERLGRRTVFSFCVAMFGALSIATAFAWDFESLFWLRAVQGLGLGGAVPIGAALVTECLPAAARGKTFSFAFAMLFSLGYLLAPLAGYLLIATLGPETGWRALFLSAGVALPFALLAYVLLPESPRWLAAKNRIAEAEKIIAKLERSAVRRNLPLAETTAPLGVVQKHTRLSEAFGKQFLGRTLLIWVLFLTIYFMQYGLNAWLPTLYVKIGHLPPQNALALAVVNGAITLGAAVVFALTVDRIGRYAWFVIAYGTTLCGTLIGFALFAYLHVTSWPFLFGATAVMTAGMSVNSGLIYLYAPELFPTRMRAWATSTGSAAGRLGSIVAPIAIGALLQAGLGITSVFLLFAAVCVIGAAAVLLFGFETKRQSLEHIAG